ncbi:MAG: phosphatase PAP2 family protein [Alphaproteobacteria bacterium]|nr:MAG: phosphatase PAP2 family protein [Alphaproteobacteria bacterium]
MAYHLALIGCEDLVSATTSKDEVGASKPCPDIFEAALRKIGPLGREDAVVIGDSPWDVKAAAKAGLRTIGFRSGGFEDATLIEAGAFVLYDGPRHLLADYENSVFAKEEEGPRAQGGRGVGEGARALCETPLIKALSPIAALGDQPQLRILCGAVIAVGLFGGDRRLARTGWRMLAAHTFATWTKDFVKHRVDRVRPRALAEKGEDATPEPGNSHAKELTSFPSGHSAGAAAVARAYARDYPEHQGPAYAAAAVLAAVQVPRCAHYPTDIGAGLAIGVAAEAAVSRLVPGLGSD